MVTAFKEQTEEQVKFQKARALVFPGVAGLRTTKRPLTFRNKKVILTFNPLVLLGLKKLKSAN